MDNQDLLRLQNIQYQMLKDTVKICNEHNIMYYLVYGTLLGAVRHSASIPWDYDIDICMDRKNFLKFLSVSDKLNDDYYISHVGSDKKTYTGITRIYKRNSKVYSFQDGKATSHPIHIDVFILDCAKNYPKAIRRRVYSFARYLRIAKMSNSDIMSISENYSNPVKRFLIRKSGIIRNRFGEEKIERMVYRLIVDSDGKGKNKHYVILSNLEFYPQGWFGEPEYLRYEDEKFKVPNKYKESLTYWYNDYMKYPPEEERFTAEMDKWKIDYGE